MTCGNWTIICHPKVILAGFHWATQVKPEQVSHSQSKNWIYKNTIYSATKLWNTEIPIQLKQSTSLKVYKKSYKNSLIPSIWWCAFSSCIIEFYIPRFTYLNWKKHLRHTLYSHFPAFWLVKWIEMTVLRGTELTGGGGGGGGEELHFYCKKTHRGQVITSPSLISKNFDFVFFQNYVMCQISVNLSLAFLFNFFTLVMWYPDRTSGLPYYLFLIIYSICMFSLKIYTKEKLIVYFMCQILNLVNIFVKITFYSSRIQMSYTGHHQQCTNRSLIPLLSYKSSLHISPVLWLRIFYCLFDG